MVVKNKKEPPPTIQHGCKQERTRVHGHVAKSYYKICYYITISHLSEWLKCKIVITPNSREDAKDWITHTLPMGMYGRATLERSMTVS